MEQPDEDKFSSGSEHQLSHDKTERKADEDHGRPSSNDRPTEEKTERKQDEDKHRTGNEPLISEEETDEDRTSFIPKGKSSRITAAKKRVLSTNRGSVSRRGVLWERLEGEMAASSSSVSRKRQARSVQDNAEEGTKAETGSKIEQGESPEKKRRSKQRSGNSEDDNNNADEKKSKKGKCGEAQCNCGKKCRCKMCVCGRGLKKKRNKKES